MKIRHPQLAFLAVTVLAIGVRTAGSSDPVAAPARTTKTVRLLTVGNSFSRNATRYLNDLATGAGHVLVHRPIIVGGASMALHWEKVEHYEKDPKDSRGSYGPQQSLKELLLAQPWDFVTIQQASIKSHDVANYRPYAGQLRDYINAHAPQAELLIHQTWAYRSDDPRFKIADPRPGEPATQEEMYQCLTRSYETIAAELGARLIPVGDAFHIADTDPKWGYQPDAKFDFKSPRHSALPDQTHSLHVGWKKGKETGTDGKFSITIDGHHANTAGEYLGACVFYETLYGESVVGNPFVPSGLDADYARFLQQTAHKAVTSRMNSKSNVPNS